MHLNRSRSSYRNDTTDLFFPRISISTENKISTLRKWPFYLQYSIVSALSDLVSPIFYSQMLSLLSDRMSSLIRTNPEHGSTSYLFKSKRSHYSTNVRLQVIRVQYRIGDQCSIRTSLTLILPVPKSVRLFLYSPLCRISRTDSLSHSSLLSRKITKTCCIPIP